jgi:hypothetical protein
MKKQSTSVYWNYWDTFVLVVLIVVMYVLSEVGGSLLRCGMLSGKICEDQR